MRLKMLLAAVLIVAMTAICGAQSDSPKPQQNRVDGFLGYSFLHNGDLPSSVPTSLAGAEGFLKSGLNIQGGTGELAVNVNHFFGLTSDLSFLHSTQENMFLFTFGPELSLRTKKSRVFGHALVGGAYETQKLAGFKLTSLADSSFAYDLGAGWDLGLSKHVALRLLQVDYIYTEAFRGSEQNVRASAGLVFR